MSAKKPFKNSAVIAYDLETAEGGKIVDYPTMASASDGETTVVAIGEQNIRALLEHIQERVWNGATLVGQNTHVFDRNVLVKWGYKNWPYGIDTMVLGYLLDENLPQSLEFMCSHYLGYSSWKGMDWKTFDPNGQAEATYAALDAWATHQLFLEQRKLLGARYNLVTDVLLPARIALDAMGEYGVYLDKYKLQYSRSWCEYEIERWKKKIWKIAGVPDGVTDKPNPNSARWIGEVLTSQGRTLELTDSGEWKTDAKTLKEINSPFSEAVLGYRGAKKLESTYIKNYERLAYSGDGRAHPKFNITRTLTGRTSAFDENTQNVPRSIQDIFTAPDTKYFVAYDYGQVEFRLAAFVAGEQSILRRYVRDPDWDAHLYFSSLLYEKPESEVTKGERQIAKSANFGLLFLGTPKTLVEYIKKTTGVTITLQFAARIHDKWHETFPGFYAWYLRTKQELEDFGEITYLTGGKRTFGDVRIMPPHMRVSCVREAVNARIQGLAAHIALLALRRLHDLGFTMVNFVHDSIAFEFESKAEHDKNIELITYSMCKYPIEWINKNMKINITVPLTVDSK